MARLLRGARTGLCASAVFAPVTCEPAPMQPVVDTKPRRIVIIGAGIVGASVAYHLAELGETYGVGNQITVIERDAVGSGASGMSAGTIWDVGNGDGSDSIACIYHRTASIIEDIETKGYNCGWHRGGGIELATTETQKKLLQTEFSKLKDHGYEVEFLASASDVSKVIPGAQGGNAIAGIYTPRAGSVDPTILSRSILDAASHRAGGNLIIMENAKVKAVSTQGHSAANREYHVLVDTEESTFVTPGSLNTDNTDMEVPKETSTTVVADIVIIAAGCWSRPIGQSFNIDIPVVPVRGSAWTSQIIDPSKSANGMVVYFAVGDEYWHSHSTKNLPARVPEFCTHDHTGHELCTHVYGRQDMEGRLLFGGYRIPTDFDDYRVDKAQIDRNITYVEGALPTIGDVDVTGCWSGLMPFSMDGRALVGSLTAFGHPDIYLATGMGGEGIMMGPAITELLAKSIFLNQDHELLQDMDLVPTEIRGVSISSCCDPETSNGPLL